MSGRALVIGAWQPPSSTERSPADRDAERVSELLASRGFQISLLTGSKATRAGILGGYTELVGSVEASEAAVIYFSGHGGLVTDLGAELGDDDAPDELPVPETFQFIAPHDYQLGTDEDFRGISSWELSLLLEGLTRQTRNATVILDCCYAAQMSRGQARAGEPRATRPTRTSVCRHFRAVGARRDLLGQLARTIQLSPLGNPTAVRLVACGEWEQAYSVIDERGRTTGGILTDALIATLHEIGGSRVPWRAIGAEIAARVLRSSPGQRALVEGPVRRRLFSLEEIHEVSIPVETGGDGPRLKAGRLAGVSVGDIYGVTRLEDGELAPSTGIAHVRVERVAALHAIAQPCEWLNGYTSLPQRAVAWPLELATDRQPIRVVAPESERAALEADVARSARLRVAATGERAIAELRLCEGTIEVLTSDETPLAGPSGPWSREGAIQQLGHLAAAQALRELQGEDLAPEEIGVEWGTVHDQTQVARPADGAAVSTGDRIYVRVRNHSDQGRYVHTFNIGVRGEIRRLSSVTPQGLLILPLEESLIGPFSEPLPGFKMVWPTGVPRDLPRIDRLVVIVTEGQTDLGAIETCNARARGTARNGSSLQRLLRQLHEGGTRCTGGIQRDPFLVVHRSWMLHPLRAPVALAGFAIDEDPTGMRGVSAREAWLGGSSGAARPLAIRLRDVEAPGAVRIDSLVCTRSADRACTYEARTFRVAAGALALELWQGPARDLVEIYLWVSPAGADAPDLAALLASERERPEVAEAIDALVVRDEQAPWALASGACAALANAAAARSRTVAPGVVGLVHASATPADADGGGRRSRYRARGVELTLEIAAP